MVALLRRGRRLRGGAGAARPALLTFGALPVLAKAWKALDEPRPEQPPAHFPVWPLWFAAIAFIHTRRAGALLVLGLIVAAVADVTIRV